MKKLILFCCLTLLLTVSVFSQSKTRIKFDKGTSSKTIRIDMPAASPAQRFVVSAAKGQTLIVTKNVTSAHVRLLKGNATILEKNDSLVAKLNKTGDYTFELENYTDNDLMYEIKVKIVKLPKGQLSGKVRSIYTDLDAKKCKTIESDVSGAGYYRGECKGFGNYKLEVIEGDIRQTINVIQKQSGDKWELDFMRNVSIGFSSVGSKAEWRVKRVNGKTRPIALIVRYNVSEPASDGTNKNKSYLVVTKFDGEFVCITNVVDPIRKQNEKARKLADLASVKPCIQN